MCGPKLSAFRTHLSTTQDNYDNDRDFEEILKRILKNDYKYIKILKDDMY
jgi:predicted component of type VI protein secretion system